MVCDDVRGRENCAGAVQHRARVAQTAGVGKAAGKIGLAVSECLVVEDACAGISAASAGGFDSAGLGDAAKDKNVTWALNTFGDLKNIVK